MSIASTYDQILEESRELFNTIGVATASIHRISESLSISSGNLTYHFKRKRDIVAAHLENFERELVEEIESFPVTGTPSEFISGWETLLAVTVKYKFLFTSSDYLLQHQLLTIGEFDKLIAHIQTEVKDRAQSLITVGLMKPIKPPFSVDTLVECIWWQWLGWLNDKQLHMTYSEKPKDAVLFDGVKHVIFLIYPHIRKKSFREACEQLIYNAR